MAPVPSNTWRVAIVGSSVLAAAGCDMLETQPAEPPPALGDVTWAEPTMLVGSLGAPRTMAQHQGSLFWGGADGRVEMVDKDGSERSALGDMAGAVVDLEFAYPEIYWIDGAGGRVWAVGVTEGQPRLLAITGGDPVAIAVDPTTVYWIEDGGWLMSMSRFGGAAVPLAQLGYEPGDVILDEGGLYVSDSAAGTIEWISVYGGQPLVVASGQQAPGRLAVDGEELFWANERAIMALDLTEPDAEPVVVADDITRPDWLRAAGGFVYWSSTQAGTIARAPKTGGAVQVVAGQLAAPADVVVDSRAVYFVTQGDGDSGGALWRVGPR